MKKKVMIAVGGTAGHVYPALSLARNLQKASVSVMFVGGGLKANRFFEPQDHLHKSVECGHFNSKNPLKLIKTLVSILKGFLQTRSAIKTFTPDLIVGFGSYHTFPSLIAAKFTKVPIILHEANSIPGKVNKLLSKYAEVTGIHFPDVATYLKGKTMEVGMPLRDGYNLGAVTKQTAKDHFFLSPNKLTILIFGGSQGAKKINELTSHAFCHFFDDNKDAIQILHFSGDENAITDLEKMYGQAGIKASVKDFEKRMDLAWQAADVVISRSGASTIAEQMEFEVPGILIPYPFASDAHQDKNALFMVKTVGGAISFKETELSSQLLGEKIKTLLNHDHILLGTMKEAMRTYKRKTRPKDLCSLVLNNLWK